MTTIRSATTARFCCGAPDCGIGGQPNTALGAYYLTESLHSEHAGAACRRLTGFEVTSTSLPDTRTSPGSIGGASARLALAAIGASVVLAFLALGPVRAGRRTAG